MSRADARINLILDEVVRTLSAIDGDPDLWLTSPKKVLRWCSNPMSQPQPLVLVRCKEWGPNEPQTGVQHDGQAVIEVELLCGMGSQADDPARELHRLAADVLSALESNWRLHDASDTPVVPGLQFHVISGYEPAVTLTESGIASTVIEFRAFWPWEAATP